ncbi:PREDICTED: dirigent protein 7 [Camelina sativa]|uniref:Dirigent protein n=1 Tax=Camelina sativa TaxID=90675 RepID=A0ABM0XK21_CAMSA|nr:PREDICTED: dirigent protein 7 [Camelina sativa]
MAKLILIIVSQILLFVSLVSAGNGENFAKTIDKKLHGLRKEKLTHFRVYWHDILSGSNPSAVVINPPISNSSFFGSVTMIDNRLTTEVAVNSTLVGQAQGIYAATGQRDASALMVMNFAFKTGKYNGSTISILGRNAVLTKVREMPVIGGSGLFRFARGYVEARTMWFDQKSGDATVEYSCYVLHY